MGCSSSSTTITTTQILSSTGIQQTNLTNPTTHPFHIPQNTNQNRKVRILFWMAHWDMGLVHGEIGEFAILLHIGHACVILVKKKLKMITYPCLNLN